MKKENGIQQHLQEIGGSVLRMNIHGKNRQLLVAAKRYVPFKRQHLIQ